MFVSIKHSINIALLFSFASIAAMEPQQSESSRRVARVMQEATKYNPQPALNLKVRQVPQGDDNTPPSLPSIRQFKIEDYKKITSKFNEQIIDDSFANCPSTLQQPLNNLLEFSYSENTLITNNLPNRFIFVGPSGCGKTLLTYAIGYKTKRPYVFVKSTELSNSFKGSCPDIINGLFKPMIDCQQPGLIILDEFMAFIKKYENKNDSDSGAVEHLWQTLDEAKLANPRLVVICTANDISNLPAMILTRFGGSQHKFEQPSDERKEKLVKQILPTSEQNEQAIKNVVKQLKNISLREITNVLNTAQFEAALRAEKTKTTINVTTLDILNALKPVLREYSERKWAQRKEKAWEVTKTIAPYALTTTVAGAGLYLSWYLHQKQAIQSEKNHQDSLSLQRAIQTESQTFSKNMQVEANKHAEKLYQKQHDANHSKTAYAKQLGTAGTGAAVGSIVSFVLYYWFGTKPTIN